MIQLEMCRIDNRYGCGQITFSDSLSGSDAERKLFYDFGYSHKSVGLDVYKVAEYIKVFNKQFECKDLTLVDGVTINPVPGSGTFVWKEISTGRLFELTYSKSIITIRVYDSKTGITSFQKEFHAEEDGEAHDQNSST